MLNMEIYGSSQQTLRASGYVLQVYGISLEGPGGVSVSAEMRNGSCRLQEYLHWLCREALSVGGPSLYPDYNAITLRKRGNYDSFI